MTATNNDVLIITGTCGVGKSTIAVEWAKLKSGAMVDCDYFTEWIFNEKFKNHTVEDELFVAGMASKVGLEYLKLNLPIAIENVWTPSGIEVLINLLKEGLDINRIKVIWLYCDAIENHRRDELRIPENQMKSRLDVVYKELAGYDWPAFVQRIDTTTHTVQQTIDMIERLPYTINSK